MFKRIVSCLLLVVMLVPVVSPVFATNANNKSQVSRNEAPSIESILNEYHKKVFAAQADANANARSGAEVQTDAIKQDTLNQLREAGYLAYDVNPDTFDSVAEELRTDLQQMDLDPNGSYIIVVGGEEETQENTASPAYIPPEIYDEGEGFEYTYNGSIYRLRYVTITSANNPGYTQSTNVNLNNGSIASNALLNTLITICLDNITPIPIGTICSLVGAYYSEVTPVSNEALTFFATATWTKKHIQVWDHSSHEWLLGSRVEYAITKCRCAGYLWNISMNEGVWYESEEVVNNVYSAYYQDEEQQKIQAVLSYINRIPNYFTTGPIAFKHGESTVVTLNCVSS